MLKNSSNIRWRYIQSHWGVWTTQLKHLQLTTCILKNITIAPPISPIIHDNLFILSLEKMSIMCLIDTMIIFILSVCSVMWLRHSEMNNKLFQNQTIKKLPGLSARAFASQTWLKQTCVQCSWTQIIFAVNLIRFQWNLFYTCATWFLWNIPLFSMPSNGVNRPRQETHLRGPHHRGVNVREDKRMVQRKVNAWMYERWLQFLEWIDKY